MRTLWVDNRSNEEMNEIEQQYMPSLRNFNRRDPHWDCSWKRRRKNQYSSEG